MKIIYCHHSLYLARGIERVVSIKANSFIDLGHDVTIVTTRQCNKQPYFQLSPKVKVIDMDIDYEPALKHSFLLRYIHTQITKFRHKKRLINILKEEKADIVISTFGDERTFLPYIYNQSKKIIEIHFTFDNYKSSLGLTHTNKLIQLYKKHKTLQYLRRFDAFVTLTEEDRKDWIKFYPFSNIQTIPNPSAIKIHAQAALNNKIILSVGSLERQKGYDMLLQAWEQVIKETKEWKLIIRGNGKKNDELQKQIKELKIEKQTFLLPATNQIEQEYLNSSVYVMSSRYEGLPMVLIEAMSCGLPLVSFTCKCGPREIIKDGYNGFLVPEENINQLAQKLKALIVDEKLRKEMGKNAFREAQRFEISKIMPQWIQLFKKLYS